MMPMQSHSGSNLEPQPLFTIQIPVLGSDDTEEVRITNAVHIGSFDWVESKKPCILVPGMFSEPVDIHVAFNNQYVTMHRVSSGVAGE